MQRMKTILKNLCSVSAVTGDERYARGLVEQIRPLCDGVRQLPCGSIVAYKKCGSPNAKKVLLDAHLDQIGLMVTKIDDHGFVHFCNHAGVDAKVLPGAMVTILGKQAVKGVVSAKPPHLLSAEEREKPMKIAAMTIDVGLSADRTKELIRVGDKIALDCYVGEMLNQCVTGRSLDDRAGCTVLLSILDLLKSESMGMDVYVVLSSGEEFSGYGAVAAALEIKPDEAIVVDVSHADMPAARSEDCGELGKGVMIGISPILDRGLSGQLLALARERQIPYQREAMGGSTGTNADGIVPLCNGIPTAVLSIPLRYMHTAQEVISLEDLVSVRDLLLAYLGKERG
ncbi:MAG: M42 family peptidase [Clostridia bacterium]|nr:M42 family peptidase [Clostridia bacterium]